MIPDIGDTGEGVEGEVGQHREPINASEIFAQKGKVADTALVLAIPYS